MEKRCVDCQKPGDDFFDLSKPIEPTSEIVKTIFKGLAFYRGMVLCPACKRERRLNGEEWVDPEYAQKVIQRRKEKDGLQ